MLLLCIVYIKSSILLQYILFPQSLSHRKFSSMPETDLDHLMCTGNTSFENMIWLAHWFTRSSIAGIAMRTQLLFIYHPWWRKYPVHNNNKEPLIILIIAMIFVNWNIERKPLSNLFSELSQTAAACMGTVWACICDFIVSKKLLAVADSPGITIIFPVAHHIPSAMVSLLVYWIFLCRSH